MTYGGNTVDCFMVPQWHCFEALHPISDACYSHGYKDVASKRVTKTMCDSLVVNSTNQNYMTQCRNTVECIMVLHVGCFETLHPVCNCVEMWSHAVEMESGYECNSVM